MRRFADIVSVSFRFLERREKNLWRGIRKRKRKKKKRDELARNYLKWKRFEGLPSRYWRSSKVSGHLRAAKPLSRLTRVAMPVFDLSSMPILDGSEQQLGFE